MSVRRLTNIGENNTVALYLGQGGTYPALSRTTLQQLIDCQAIVHYTRSGTRTIVDSPSFSIQNGEFLVVADSGTSGTEHTLSIELVKNDCAYIMGSGENADDRFYTSANKFMDRRPSTIKITNSHSLVELLSSLTTGREITSPIGNVLIVSHARGEGILYFKLNDADDYREIYPSDLYFFVNDSGRIRITSRIIRNDAETIIRICGCTIGKQTGFLQQLKKLFGGNVTVVAPKHIQTYGNFNDNGTDIVYESMFYDFMVTSKERFRTKDQLKQAFISAGFRDIRGNAVTEAQWGEWIPSDIDPDGTRTEAFSCTTPPVPALASVIVREYTYRNRTVYIDPLLYGPDETPPAATAEARRTALREALLQDPKMQSNYPGPDFSCPDYMSCGYRGAAEMFDGLSWSFDWIISTRELMCTGSRHEYIVRIPITETDSSLICNILENTGERSIRHTGLAETDTRLFGRV